MDDKLVSINQTTLEALEEVDTAKIVKKFTDTGIKVLSADFGIMFWKPENQGSYQIMYVSPQTPYKPKLPRKRGYNYKASLTRKPYFVSNPIQSISPYMKSLVSIPIFYKNHQYGSIVLCFKKPRVFTEEEKPLMMTLSNATAQVLTIHRAQKKTEKDSLKLLKQKDEFFNIVSHELKTPVTTIKGFSQILTNKLKKSDTETKYFLEKVNSQVDKLARLIEDLSNVSHLDAGKLNFKKTNFELQNLIKQTVEGLKVAVPSHPISFTSDYKFWIHGDSARLEEVLTNLITNAAKYSPAKSKIKVSLTKKDDMAYVEVEDFGYGIKEKDRAKVFTRFFQSKSVPKEHMLGLGLGLYIASSIVKNHGSMLDFKTKTTSPGTIFYFSLPYYRLQKHKN